jgi:hypothetical protein
VAGLREELAQAQTVFKSLSAPAPAAPEAQPDAGQSALAEELRALQGRYEALEKAVSSRPVSPHPRQGPQRLPGAETTLTKDQTLDLLEKSFTRGEISEDEYFRTSALLDHAQRARASFVEVVRANAPGALPLIKSVLEV